MLMQLGPVSFEVQPFNTHGNDHDHETPFAEKPVVGARPPLEWVGEGAETWTIDARIYPDRLGGLDTLERLRQARAAGQPLYLMRGDGVSLGWVAITRVREKSTYLNARGVGQVIEISITVRRTDGPSPGSYYSVFSGFL